MRCCCWPSVCWCSARWRAPRWKFQPYLYATFVTCALLGGTSFSLWQPWFMASFGFAAGFAVLGWALAERTAAESATVRSTHALDFNAGL